MTFSECHKTYYKSLYTQRLCLRPLKVEDADDMFVYTSFPDNFKYIRRCHHLSRDEDIAFLEQAENSYREHTDFIWGICKKEDSKLIGTCRLFHIDLENLHAEVSYMVSQECAGNGIATEAIKRLIEFCFTELGLVRVEAHCAAGNLGSEKVMQKAGMCYEGTLRKDAIFHGHFVDIKCYAIIKT